MAWKHFKAATESNLYDGQGSYKNIMYRICALARKDGHLHAGWCTASENFLAQTTGFSLRQVQRAVAQFKRDGVFTIRTYRKGGKEFNHYRPQDALFAARKRKLEELELVFETHHSDVEDTDDEEPARQNGGRSPDTVSPTTRQLGGVVCISREVEGEEVNAVTYNCRAELRSTDKGYPVADINPLTGKNHGGGAPIPPLCSVQVSREETPVRLDLPAVSLLQSAAGAAEVKTGMLAALAARVTMPAPPSKESLALPPTPATPRPTTPFQVAKALIEKTKESSFDTYLRAYSLGFQFAGYLEERAAKGEKAYPFRKWEVMYTADFIDAFDRGWKFKNIEDAIDIAQTTKFRFSCCTPRLLLDHGESLMKQVWAMRRNGTTARQKLGERYPSWYLDNAHSLEVEGGKPSLDFDLHSKQAQREAELQVEKELDEDVPIRTLSTMGRIRCINQDCPYRFDTWEMVCLHFDECFAKTVEEMPIDPQDALDEEFADVFDDECGVLPPAIYAWRDEDEAEIRGERYAPHNPGGGMMFNPWADEDAASMDDVPVQYEPESLPRRG